MLIRRSVLARPVFAWRTSTRPGLVRLRSSWDDIRLRRATSVRSTVDGPLTLGYLGLPEGTSHVMPFLEEQAARGGPVLRRSTRTVPWAEALAPADVDLMAIGAPPARVRPLLSARDLLLPFRVELVVPVVPDVAAMRARVSRKERQRVARQRRDLGWKLEHTAAAEDFQWFYDHVHLPTMRRRHGPATRSLERDIALQCVFRRGFLFFLTDEHERVAGMLCLFDRRTRTLTLRLAGVTHGAPAHYATGAFAALYVLILEWAAVHDVRAVNLSGCEPFLSKGIFQFKRKLHPQVVRPADHFGAKRLLLRVVRDTPRVRDFLVANPVIAEAPGGGLEAVYFHDDRRAARLDLRWEGTGLRGARLTHLDSFLRSTSGGGTPFVSA
ncbi:hypothetical protein J5U46_02515 [Micromonospora tulbaghiae]|uniref:GNAT family N-acetyltransferase n=1 Tax=Micromonospora tulbaghiae TaxID=479978 RepID=A0AAW4JBU6_9ACTN|nr:hypothetical protein [Micromonospora tulbaghiae]MBO4139029.1 hypothetical protein [Micromonospora tulbaghiae]MDX5459311.1 hypothetical protein [Micromonospora tulbaghiae]SCE72952.1 hypothetical protein GA0070562_2059 [Micromonospora tulbaghiae]